MYELVLDTFAMRIVEISPSNETIFTLRYLWRTHYFYIRKMLNILIKLNNFDSTYALLRC